MSKPLVAYFSASGKTERVARNLANVIDAELFEIEPAVPYVGNDLDWMSESSRSSWEMKHPESLPELKGTLNTQEFNPIFVGFPIWWYTAPTIIHAFLKSIDTNGKTIIPFATSGGSGMGKTSQTLQALVPDAKVEEGTRFTVSANKDKLKAWADTFLQ